MDRLIDSYIEELIRRKFSDFTVKSYQVDLEEFGSFLRKNGKNDFSGIDRKDIRGFMGELLSYGYKKTSVSRKLSAVKSFCKFLVRNKVIKSNPSLSVKTPRTDKPIPSFLSEEEVGKMLDFSPLDTELDIRNRAILELLYATGIRASELVNLDISMFDANNRLLRVDSTRPSTYSKKSDSKSCHITSDESSYDAPYFCDSPFEPRSELAGCSGTSGARVIIHDADLYPYEYREIKRRI
jgi:site-specific recombinase XerD